MGRKGRKKYRKAIINNAKSTLRWLTGLGYTNYPDHIPSEAEKIIFAYAMKTGIYSEEEIQSITFNHGEDKNLYIEKYLRVWQSHNSQPNVYSLNHYLIDNPEELLKELKLLGEYSTNKLKDFGKKETKDIDIYYDPHPTCDCH